jgi:hypothetical protein
MIAIVLCREIYGAKEAVLRNGECKIKSKRVGTYEEKK